ncbi:BAG family molecular chaperone regulator 8 like [Actinidia chinensis var. chinensis]|uniref:BAG family molecular chaperone regulator 8 like n=1 Tax=Actinidia chinensis var. chinensis TaxID=1590841 RepID=A0A2R6P9R3_ACTCC|nr:BAG family molecular chaperone regulator 8 like [Actinidia chinensis var. chinensis]
MASHHHRPITTTTTNPCCCCCYYTCPPPPDPLLHPLNPQIQHPPPQPYHHHSPPQPYHHSPYLNAPCDPQIFHHHHHHHHHQQQQQTPHYPPPTHQKNQDLFPFHHYHHLQEQTQPTVSSLLRRIAALESSLLLRQRHFHYSADSTSSFSLRASAARTIQTHFRAFLVRRSRTLRQLKELASIKSTLNALKASISDNTHIDSQALSRRAMDLLLKLDSIQGGDPMIRDGKRSISRDLIRFLEFIDGVSVKRNRVSTIALKSVRLGATGNKSRVFYSGQKIGAANFVDFAGDERELMEKQRNRGEKIRGIYRVNEDDDEEGIEIENPRISINGMMASSHNRNGGLVKRHGGDQATVKKTVRFAENGNVSRVSITTHDPSSSEEDGSGSIDDERGLVDTLCREVQEIGGFSKGSENDDEEAHTEDGESAETNKFEIRGQYVDDDGDFVFSAPLPVKMESRTDLVKNRKVVRIVN